MKLVFRAQCGVQGCGDARRLFLGRSTKAVTQARAGSVASASLRVGLPLGLGPGVQTAGWSDLPPGPEALLAQEDPAVPFMELLGPMGAWSRAGRLRGELASGSCRSPPGQGARGALGAEQLSVPRSPLTSEASSEARGREALWAGHTLVSHPRLSFWPAQCTGGRVSPEKQ